ncbi:MAG: response regulator transcription factor [Caldilineaceae bacterium]|nr:response regulator transcription factor [Caldilineaceae bacterium]
MKPVRTVLICDGESEVAGWNTILKLLEIKADLASTRQIVRSPMVVGGYDLVILDTGDVQSNIVLCRMLRPVHKGVLLLCADDPDESYLMQGYGAGADDVVAKCAGARLLQAKLAAWCRRIEWNVLRRYGLRPPEV